VVPQKGSTSLGNFREATETAHWAVRLQPGFWLARQALAACLSGTGRNEAAADYTATLRQSYPDLSALEFAAWVPYAGRHYALAVAQALAQAGWR